MAGPGRLDAASPVRQSATTTSETWADWPMSLVVSTAKVERIGISACGPP